MKPFGDKAQTDQPLARYTAARLGGPADYLYMTKDPDLADAKALLRQAWDHDIPATIIGGGANILVSDKGIRGLTIINRAGQLGHDGGDCVTAASGASLIRLARYCQRIGRRGLEWAIAVPGTVGGAVVNNAGAHGAELSDVLHHALVYEAEGGARCYGAAELDYDYRHSWLKSRGDQRFMVLQACFRLEKDEPTSIQARMNQYNAYRRQTQPPGASLGSIFKNPPSDYAGRLIEAAGLKGYRIGDVQVSPIHANFFVSAGEEATARDYLRLIRAVQRRVKQVFGRQLELEIQIVGDWDECDQA